MFLSPAFHVFSLPNYFVSIRFIVLHPSTWPNLRPTSDSRNYDLQPRAHTPLLIFENLRLCDRLWTPQALSESIDPLAFCSRARGCAHPNQHDMFGKRCRMSPEATLEEKSGCNMLSLPRRPRTNHAGICTAQRPTIDDADDVLF